MLCLCKLLIFRVIYSGFFSYKKAFCDIVNLVGLDKVAKFVASENNIFFNYLNYENYEKENFFCCWSNVAFWGTGLYTIRLTLSDGTILEGDFLIK